MNAFIAYIFLEARDYDSAVDAALKALEFDAAAPLPYFPLGRAHAKLDDFRRAIEALAEALRLGGSVPRFEASLGFAYARAGERAEAEAILDRFSRGPLASVVSPVERALVALGLGDTNAALCDLEAAYAARQPWVLVAGDPFFSQLGTERRYRDLMARLRLPIQA